jgi:hypothetical protein
MAKLVKAEKTLLYTELKAADHTNPSTVWARIRKYGQEERHGKPEGARVRVARVRVRARVTPPAMR